jgi:hypothetical protein
MSGVADLGSLSNTGTMPISAGGGAAGGATSGGKSGFSVGAINMGSGGMDTKTVLIIAALAVGAWYLVKRK